MGTNNKFEKLALTKAINPPLKDKYTFNQRKTERSESVSCSVMSPLCNHVDNSPPGSSVHGIFQARILEWVTIPFSKKSS